MNYKLIIKILSCVFMIVGAALILPAVIGLIYHETFVSKVYLILAAALIIIGFAVFRIIPKSSTQNLRIKDGFVVVASSWMSMSLIGALPFVFSGDIPNYFDAFFESASGFSTTGSTILTDVEIMSHAGLFWRSFTHWLGGMGLLVMTIALLPKLGIGGHRLMRAETSGISLGKDSFTFNQVARNLYKIYFALTISEFILLILAGMSPFDSIIHTFGSVGTGGLSSYNNSVAAFNSVAIEMIIAIFILICGINFSNLALIFTGKIKKAFLDAELKIYLGIIAIASIVISGILVINHYYGIGDSLRYSFFQVVSIITTTGYGTADFDLWPEACKFIIFILMLIGGCAGSTAGGIKVIRIALLFKLLKRGAMRKLHPNNIVPIRLGKNIIDDDLALDCCGFFGLYAFTAIGASFLLCLDNVDILTALSSVVSSLSNIGPGFNLVGPSCNFAFYSSFSKCLLAVLMIAGRLELYTIFVSFKSSHK